MLKEGDKIPTFSIKNNQGDTITNASINGKTVVFYFYPKDDTPGCTQEGKAFSDNLHVFNEKGVEVYGISKCSVKKHANFCDKYAFQHELLSDEHTTLCEDFGVWVEKSMYGRKYMGIERSTFLIDEHGVIKKAWYNVKVPGHVDDVLTHI